MGTLLLKNARLLATMDDQRRKIPGGGIYRPRQRHPGGGTDGRACRHRPIA